MKIFLKGLLLLGLSIIPVHKQRSELSVKARDDRRSIYAGRQQ